MQTNELDHARLRRLAALRPDQPGKVLTIYLDLDPTDFGTQPARAAQISSLLDEADRRARNLDPADDETRCQLRADVAHVRKYLRGGDFSAKGAHALAVFCSGPAELFEVLRLPQPVPGTVVINDTPWLDPLIGHERRRRCLALVSRRLLRVFADRRDGELHEVESLLDEVHGQHEQGGWSQARYERSVEEDVRDHLKRSAQALFARLRRTPFDVLAVGAAPELWPDVERALHPYLRERCVGRFDVDVERANAEQALAAAQPLLDAAQERRLARLLARLQAGVGRDGARGAHGLTPVLHALNERRVEALLYDDRFAAAGDVCPRCGWLGGAATAAAAPSAAASCPVCGETAERHEQVLDEAIAAALLQSADVVALRDRPELGPLGGIAALLRF